MTLCKKKVKKSHQMVLIFSLPLRINSESKRTDQPEEIVLVVVKGILWEIGDIG